MSERSEIQFSYFSLLFVNSIVFFAFCDNSKMMRSGSQDRRFDSPYGIDFFFTINSRNSVSGPESSLGDRMETSETT